MSRTTNFKGSPLELVGNEVKIGDKIPAFKVTGNDMQDVTEYILKDKVAVIVTVPSLDTPVCSIEAAKFNKEASKLGDKVTVLVVSRDLPFAQKRWCAAEGAERVITASDYKYRNFGPSLGAHIKDWDLNSRAVFVADKSGTIKYVEYVPEVSAEPRYDEVLKIAAELAV